MTKAQTERLGVASLEYFFAEHGWLFREQPTHDYGIDAHVEIVEGQRPTGKLIALQIKSGMSFFSEETDDAFIFRTDDKHATYWISHSMPVVVVLYNPETKQTFYQHVSQQTIEQTGKLWKMSVPKVNIFEQPERTLAFFNTLTQPEPYIRRLNRLRTDRRWIDLIDKGCDVRVQFDDWVNKSLPRYQLTISSADEKEVWPALYTPGRGVEEMLRHFFPWADFSLDIDAHRQSSRGDWDAYCYAGRDSETGEVYYSESFDSWYEPQEGIVPVSEDGEIASYSLLLSLNEFGRSFIAIDDYLADQDAPDNIGFILE